MGKSPPYAARKIIRFLYKLQEAVQLITAFGVAAALAVWLHKRGWLWLEWLPAAILAFLGMGVFWILIWYAVRKTTYEKLAARTKAQLRAKYNSLAQQEEKGEKH